MDKDIKNAVIFLGSLIGSVVVILLVANLFIRS